MSRVAITKCTSYRQEEVYQALKKVLENSDVPDVRGKKVLLKPNILSDSPASSCITTNPEIVRSAIKLFFERGASEIYVGDSPGLQTSSFSGKTCGIYDVCQEEGAVWTDFSTSPTPTLIKGTSQTLPLASILKEGVLTISICKFKTHQLMYTTGAVKNLFGLVPGLNKSPCHLANPTRESFAKLIVGIHNTVQPSFAIMDAVLGMEGPGPANGKPKLVGLIMSSDNLFALDYAQAVIMGYKPNDIPILNEGKRQHLLPQNIDFPLLNAENLVINDYERIKLSRKTNLLTSLVIPFFTRGYHKKKQKKEPAPLFNENKCIHCAKCINICPAKALSFNEKKAVVADYDKCIRCYCCHEMCPADAISINQ
ncbi:MAG: DUF362 domain-containing protein [Sphaerochaetaceae bacterium]|nr:DUF362 domain-containing protein [Sphaerochaetaceae bacterium]